MRKISFKSNYLNIPMRMMFKISAKILNAEFHLYESYYFELTSIVKVSTYKEREAISKKIKEGGGCFIATACYGNYDAPEVLILRQYRDEKLLKSLFGKAFVKFYYSVSPFFAKIISKSDLLKKSIRKYFLTPIVTKLEPPNY